MKSFLFLLFLLAGCQSLIPNTISPELEHMSHTSQHQPFTNQPTTYGADVVSLFAGWALPYSINIEVGEGYAVNPRPEIIGPREQFNFRARYTFQVRP